MPAVSLSLLPAHLSPILHPIIAICPRSRAHFCGELRGIYVGMISSLSLLFSPSGEPWTWVLFLWFFTSSRRVMSTLVSISQMQLSSFCLFISSHFLPTLAHLLQERFSSFTCSFLIPLLHILVNKSYTFVKETNKIFHPLSCGMLKRGT